MPEQAQQEQERTDKTGKENTPPDHRALNGVDTVKLMETMDMIKQDPELAKCEFRATNKWVYGGHNRASVKSFYAAGDEDKAGQNRFCSIWTNRPSFWERTRGKPGRACSCRTVGLYHDHYGLLCRPYGGHRERCLVGAGWRYRPARLARIVQNDPSRLSANSCQSSSGNRWHAGTGRTAHRAGAKALSRIQHNQRTSGYKGNAGITPSSFFQREIKSVKNVLTHFLDTGEKEAHCDSGLI